jgi:hypothetical protein
MTIRCNERHRRRASDTRIALALQLDHVREEAGFKAIVLADPQGLVVSSSGEERLCMELAALAPIASRGEFLPLDTLLEGEWMHVRTLDYEGTELFLASCHEHWLDESCARLDTWLAATGYGVKRILAA